jgi:hypothetical protein
VRINVIDRHIGEVSRKSSLAGRPLLMIHVARDVDYITHADE